MKKILLLIFLSALTLEAGAQGIEKTRKALTDPGFNTARIEVKEEADAGRAITAADRAVKKEKVMGYRVSLFRDNNQTAGENARSVAAQFKKQFPGIPVQVEYASPYFRVTAGNFVDKVDAIALCGKAVSSFPKALVIQEELSVADMVSQQKSAFVEEANTAEVVE